jgi:HNH endonuclease
MKGTIDRDGYRHFWINRKGEPRRRISEQRFVWEQMKGPIPEGMDVHHRDENKLNNEIDNLELVPKPDHARMHRRKRGNYELRNGVWHKPCRECFAVLPLDAFYDKPSGVAKSSSKHCWCKPCYNKKVVKRRRSRVNS